VPVKQSVVSGRVQACLFHDQRGVVHAATRRSVIALDAKTGELIAQPG